MPDTQADLTARALVEEFRAYLCEKMIDLDEPEIEWMTEKLAAALQSERGGDATRASLLKKAEKLWAELQEDNLGGFSGVNRPFWIAETLKEVAQSEREAALMDGGEWRTKLAEQIGKTQAAAAEAVARNDEVWKLHNGLTGKFDQSAEERTEWIMQQSLDGLMIGPTNRGTVKEILISHFRYAAAEARRAGIAVLEKYYADVRENEDWPGQATDSLGVLDCAINKLTDLASPPTPQEKTR